MDFLVGHAEEGRDLVGVPEEVLPPDHARKDRAHRENGKRRQHGLRAFMGVVVGVVVATRLAPEGQEHQPPGVERGEERRQDQHPEGEHRRLGVPPAKALSITASFDRKPAKPM
jgi:hypothetical protein